MLTPQFRRPGFSDQMVKVFTYNTQHRGRGPEDIAEDAFAAFNDIPRDGEGQALARQYRARRLRSLSFPRRFACCGRSCCIHRSVVMRTVITAVDRRRPSPGSGIVEVEVGVVMTGEEAVILARVGVTVDVTGGRYDPAVAGQPGGIVARTAAPAGEQVLHEPAQAGCDWPGGAVSAG